MARGMAAGERIVSQANTAEYGSGYDRTFGPREPQRGTWVADRDTGEMVPISEYVPPSGLARDAPIITGRIHEGLVAPDGTDIGTRSRRRAWMREHDVVDYDDCKTLRAKKRARDEAVRTYTTKPDLKLRDEIAKKLYDAKLHR